MPEDVVSPGNKWFSNDLSDNDTTRKKRNIVFEEGELAREASWPWVVGITSKPKQDYCHVEVFPVEDICEFYTFGNYTLGNHTLGNHNLGKYTLDDIVYAEYEDLINLEDIKERL